MLLSIICDGLASSTRSSSRQHRFNCCKACGLWGIELRPGSFISVSSVSQSGLLHGGPWVQLPLNPSPELPVCAQFGCSCYIVAHITHQHPDACIMFLPSFCVQSTVLEVVLCVLLHLHPCKSCVVSSCVWNRCAPST
jgi:hypothetical protein